MRNRMKTSAFKTAYNKILFAWQDGGNTGVNQVSSRRRALHETVSKKALSHCMIDAYYNNMLTTTGSEHAGDGETGEIDIRANTFMAIAPHGQL